MNPELNSLSNFFDYQKMSPVFCKTYVDVTASTAPYIIIPLANGKRNCASWWTLFISNIGENDLTECTLEVSPDEENWSECDWNNLPYKPTPDGTFLVPSGETYALFTEYTAPAWRIQAKVAAGTTKLLVQACTQLKV